MSNLKLRYAFLTSKNPLVASPGGGGDPVYTDLVVIISNPNQTGTITLREIDITIPVGSDTMPGDLSADPHPFSGPIYDKKCGWKITGDGEIITLSPYDPADPGKTTGTISGSVVFTLPNVAVNTQAGTVQLTVLETWKSGAPAKDPLTHTLVKQENDYVITSFLSDPAMVNDIHKAVTLFWTTTDAGKDLTYRIPLIGDGTYQRADGIRGVDGPTVDATTTFTLDAITTSGGKKILASADATVLVEAPAINQDSTFDQSPSGLLMGLRWVASNAGRMQVSLDTKVVDAFAPRDTYDSPFSLVVQGGPDLHQVDLVAFAGTGRARASKALPEFKVSKPVMVPFHPLSPVAIAAMDDVVLVAVGNVDDQHPAYLWVLDRTTGAVQKKVPIGKSPTSIAAVPGAGPLRVLAMNNTLRELTVVDVDAGTATVIGLSEPCQSMAVTPDGAFALLTSAATRSIVVIDLKTLTVDKTPIPLSGSPLTIAITPDGSTALVPRVADSKVTLTAVDIAGRRETGPPLPLPTLIWNLVVPPDESLALASDADGNAVIVIDLGSWTLENDRIAVGPAPAGIAVTPDGRYAFTANASADSESQPSVSVIDIAARATCAEVHVGTHPPTDVVISPDGLCAAVYMEDAVALL